jgi:acylphosphatase
VSEIARRVVVHGRVQGVFFREATRRRASRAGVAGWVRNTDEGTVEAWFEGEAEDVDVLVHFVETGPSGAHVERVEVHEVAPEDLRGFEVR